MRPLHLGTFLLSFLIGHPCPADTVTLKDGRRLVGHIAEDLGKEIVLVLRYGKMTIPKADVASIEEGPTPEEVYRDRAAKIGDDDLEGLLDLARWCRSNDLDREERWEWSRVLEIDMDHEEARKALGFVRHEGEWITKDEHREITRYPWVRPMRERLEARKVSLDHTREGLIPILRDLADQTGEVFRLGKFRRLEKFKMTYRCRGRPATDVLEDFARSVKDFDYVFTEEGVLLTTDREARKIRQKYGMPNRPRAKKEEDIAAALRSRHLTLLFIKRPLAWVLRYLETIGEIGIILEVSAPEEPFSYNCTSKPLGDILDDILRPRGLRYEIVGATLVIRKN